MTLKEYLALLKYMVLHPLRGSVLLANLVRTRYLVTLYAMKARPFLEWAKHDHPEYGNELHFLKDGHLPLLPYRRIGKEISVEGGYERGCPFVIHDGKKLYFPWCYRFEDARGAYKSFIQDEGLLGGGSLEKSPHSYVKPGHTVEEGDVIVDVGCSEALFAFHFAEKASRVYLFESDKKWMAPLNLTFGPYKDKTIVYDKRVDKESTGSSIRLQDGVQVPDDAVCFVKLDIEGWERDVLAASKDFLTSHKVKISCCLYHRQDDEAVISRFLKECGYSVSYSDGYMLCFMNKVVEPYFRKGMLYARNF